MVARRSLRRRALRRLEGNDVSKASFRQEFQNRSMAAKANQFILHEALLQRRKLAANAQLIQLGACRQRKIAGIRRFREFFVMRGSAAENLRLGRRARSGRGRRFRRRFPPKRPSGLYRCDDEAIRKRSDGGTAPRGPGCRLPWTSQDPSPERTSPVRGRWRSGSTRRLSRRNSKCSCGPSTFPVLPTLDTTCPFLTRSPFRTNTRSL